MRGRARFGVAVAIGVAALACMSAGTAMAQQSPGVPITFLVASCAPDSSMYTRVVSGQDPTSGENGTASAVPSDIAAYGCTPGGGQYTLALLSGSTANGTFSDPGLTTAVSSSSPGISSGQSFYAVSGQAATRQFYTPQFAITGTDWPGLPFLDLQCGTDGVHNDNGDGIGWGDQAITGQAYCILYVAGAAATPTATATPSPTPSPIATATPSPTATLSATASPGATVIATPSPSVTGTTTAPPSVSVTATASPSGTDSATVLSSATTTVVATSTTAPPVATPVAVNKTFQSATDSAVTWKLVPSRNGDVLVWDKRAATCQAFGGANCGTIADGGGHGTFSSSGAEQYLLVTQLYTKQGDSCQVDNTADWADPSTPSELSHVSASYKCSGTPALGWPLLVVGFMGAAGVAWFVRRRRVAPWSE